MKRITYHLTDHIYITQFRDEVILLDLKRDKYIVCLKQFSDLLMRILEGSPVLSSEIEEVYSLVHDGIIEKKKSPFPFYIDRKLHSEGVENVDWRLPLENIHVPFNLEVVRAFLTLLKVNFYIKLRGFYPGIRLIKKARNKKRNYLIPTNEDLRALADNVNKACFLYPMRTKCLEWAMTFVLLALKRRWKCNLEIGVQNYPFLAHAWVECDGNIVMDSEGLRDDLAIILNEPFRKIRE